MNGINADQLRQFAVLIAIVGAILINTLSNLFPLKGSNVGEMANTLFTGVHIIPANYAFAIWGLIYLGLLALGFYQLRPAERYNVKLQQNGWLLVMASIAQICWIYLFQARLFTLSTVAMLAILLPLMAMYQRLGIPNPDSTRQERWLLEYPISLYTGWIAVATVVNVALNLYSLDWNNWGISGVTWTIIMMVICAVIALVVALRRQDIVLPLVFVWGLVAIAVKQYNSIPWITLTGMGLALIVAGVVVYQQALHQRWVK
jgi:hypothetical protein